MTAKKINSFINLSEAQIQARDEIANFLRTRMGFIVEDKIKGFIKKAAAGELEGVDQMLWEWTITIEGKEMEHLQRMTRIMLDG